VRVVRSRRKRRRNGNVPSYEEAHWGLKPTDVRTADVCEPGDNTKLVGLGALVSVVYLTEKGGDGELVEYEHHFKPSDMPLLAYGDTDGNLYVIGGAYYITKHGIVD
jgi:hypothetical protein